MQRMWRGIFYGQISEREMFRYVSEYVTFTNVVNLINIIMYIVAKARQILARTYFCFVIILRHHLSLTRQI